MRALKEIGVLTKDSSIFLEILTKDSAGEPADVDYPVVAKIERLSTDGLQTIDSVTLNTVNRGILHQLEYKLSDIYKEGKYQITYEVSIQDKIYKKKETFNVQSELPQSLSTSGYIQFPESSKEKVDYGQIIRHLLPPDFQSNTELEVIDDLVHITLTEDISPNSRYSIVLTDEVRSADTGESIGNNYEVSFTSNYTPLYASPLEVKSILKDIFFYFPMGDIYEAIRNAGQKAHQMLRIPASPEESGFELIRENDDARFPAQKFSAYEAANQLLNQLIIKMIYANEETSEDAVVSPIDTREDDSFTLGDFSVSKKSGSSQSGQGANEPIEVSVLQGLVESNLSELKFWKDALMGRNARGYSTPISATSRGGVIAPESRDI